MGESLWVGDNFLKILRVVCINERVWIAADISGSRCTVPINDIYRSAINNNEHLLIVPWINFIYLHENGGLVMRWQIGERFAQRRRRGKISLDNPEPSNYPLSSTLRKIVMSWRANSWVHPKVVDDIVVSKVIGNKLFGQPIGSRHCCENQREEDKRDDERVALGFYYYHYSLWLTGLIFP